MHLQKLESIIMKVVRNKLQEINTKLTLQYIHRKLKGKLIKQEIEHEKSNYRNANQKSKVIMMSYIKQ